MTTVQQTGSIDLAAQNNAAKTATNYITVDSSGIKIHNTNDNSNYQHLTSDGTEIYKSGNSVAAFGNTARIGKSDSLHMNLSNGGIRLYEKEETPYTDASVAKFTIDESVIGYTTDIHTSISSGGFQLLNGESKLFTIDTEPIWVSHTCHNDDYEVKSFTFDEIFGEGTITTNDAIIDFSSGDNIHASGAGDGWFFIESSILRAKPQIYFNLTDQTLDLARPWIPIDDEDIADYFKYEYLEPEHYQQDTYRFWFRVQWTPISNFLPLEWKIGFGHYNYDITTQIGKNNESRMELDYHSMRLMDKEGGTYFYVSDLRGTDGTVSITQTWTTSGSGAAVYALDYEAKTTDYAVTIKDGNGNDVTSQYTINKGKYTITSTPTPPAGYTLTATYNTESQLAKAYTAGIRKSGEYVAPMSFAEGNDTTASGYCSHAEGYDTTASGPKSHAEGHGATASGLASHAEGYGPTASGLASHAEGHGTTTASGKYSHAEGDGTTASDNASHAEGHNTTASGYASHAQNYQTTAAYDYQTAIGTYNKNEFNNAFEIGNGISGDPSNAFAVDWDGNVEAEGFFNGIGVSCDVSWTGTVNTSPISTDVQIPITSLAHNSSTKYYTVDSSAKGVKILKAGNYLVQISMSANPATAGDLMGLTLKNSAGNAVIGPHYTRVGGNYDELVSPLRLVTNVAANTVWRLYARNNSAARGTVTVAKIVIVRVS